MGCEHGMMSFELLTSSDHIGIAGKATLVKERLHRKLEANGPWAMKRRRGFSEGIALRMIDAKELDKDFDFMGVRDLRL